jgi:hypothetical protein
MRRYLSGLALLAALGFLVGGRPAAAQNDPAGWGTVKGQVVWSGEQLPPRPELEAIKQHQDKNHCLAKGPVLGEEWVVNPKGMGIRWVFVWLAPESDQAGKLPVHPTLKVDVNQAVEIDQPQCAFIPHALAMQEGQKLVSKNSSPVVHNVNWTGFPRTNPGGNVILPAGKAHVIEGLKADRYPVVVACNIHPWMKAYVRIFDHPYFAVTDENGNFEIKMAPAGKYRLVVWHETGFRGGAEGRSGTPITIKSDGVTDLGKLEMKAPQ